MSLESFYGGKQGVSPVIRARFKYVDTNDVAYQRAIQGKTSDEIAVINAETMELCFANVNYEDVWYGQLAIIDTKNKRNPNNGKLFRRVLTRTADEAKVDGGTLHGEYIGRIIGPSEGYPKIRLGSKQSLMTQIQSENGSTETGAIEYSFPVGENEIVDTYDFTEVNPADLVATVASNQLIPGYDPTKSQPYEKGIHYSWVNVRNNIDGKEQESYVYLGFAIPTTYFDFDFNAIDWRNNSLSHNWDNETAYKNGSQPFYQKRTFGIPRGVKGNGVGFLTRTTFGKFINSGKEGATEILYDFKDLYEENTGKFDIKDYQGNYPQFEEDNLTEDSTILVYTFYMYDSTYDNDNKTKIVTCYFGKITDIKDIELDDDGSFNIYYSSGQVKTLNTVKWIDSIEMYASNQDEGEEYPVKDTLKINYNTGESEIFDSLRFLQRLRLYTDSEEEYQHLQAIYTNSPVPEDVNNFYFYQLDGLHVDPSTKELTYHTTPKNAPLHPVLNEYRQFDNPVILNSVEDIFLDPSDGYGYVKFSSSAKRYTGTQDVTEPYLPYARDIHIETGDENWPKGTWKRGGNFPDAVVPTGQTESAARQNWSWWYELGLIRRDLVSGVKFAADFNTERYIAYYQETHSGQTPQLEGLTQNAVIEILQDEWAITQDGVTYSTNPYINGNIFIYALGDNTNLINPEIIENKRGQLVYFDGYAYYYDNNNSQDGSRWKCAGDWNSSSSTMQLKIKTEAGTLIPEEIEALDKGFTILTEVTTQENAMPWNDIWAGTGA